MNNNKQFISRLQSIRGLAALIVAAFHSVLSFNHHGSDARVSRLAENIVWGQGAVFIFFILSGFVLGLTLSKRAPRDLSVGLDFLRRRFFRLFPMMLVTTAIYSIFYLAISPIPVTPPFSGLLSYRPPVSFDEVIRNLGMLSTTLNPATWSLQVEWLFSLMIPIIYFGIGRRLLPNFIILGLLYVIACVFGFEALKVPSTHAPWAYLYMCYAGFVVAISMAELKTVFNRVPKSIIIGSTVAALLICLTTPHFGYHRPLFTVAGTYLIGVIALNIAPSFFRVLDARPLIVLGDISYSFYLLNPLCLILAGKVICLYVPVTMLDRHVWLSTMVLFLLSVLLTTPLSYLSYYFCERPFTSSHKKKARMADTIGERMLAPQFPA